jgi:hypothetical protein
MTADLVLHNANVYTMDEAVPRGRAVAVLRDRIIAVGEDRAMLDLLAPGGRAVDLAGQTVVPGFVDAHLHLLSVGLALKRIDLSGATTLAEALARVAERAACVPAGNWLVGQGWDHALWGGLPTRSDLDRVAPRHPVCLHHKCGHASWVNSDALEQAGITSATPDPPGGAIERDPATGEPTGILKEDAAAPVRRLLSEPTAAEADEAVRAAVRRAHRAGLVGVHSMESKAGFHALQRLRAAGDLRLRVLTTVPERALDGAEAAGIASGFGNEWLRLGGVKIFADGALGSHTAYLLDPYEYEPGYVGISTATPEHLCEVVGRAAQAGLAAFIHAIGDRANREALDAIESSRRAGFGSTLRHRIEHAQLLHPADVPRFAELGVAASMQPIHATQDFRLVDEHWGARGAAAYAFRSLLDSGVVVAFGSDCPVEDLSPLVGIHAAVTRRRADGSPGPEGWYPEQRLTVAEAMRAYTMGAAWASGEEAERGSLSPGKLADLVVLSQDLFAIDPMAILETAVHATVVGGVCVHGADEFGLPVSIPGTCSDEDA